MVGVILPTSEQARLLREWQRVFHRQHFRRGQFDALEEALGVRGWLRRVRDHDRALTQAEARKMTQAILQKVAPPGHPDVFIIKGVEQIQDQDRSMPRRRPFEQVRNLVTGECPLNPNSIQDLDSPTGRTGNDGGVELPAAVEDAQGSTLG